MSTAIIWFRNDLRLADNPALNHACNYHQQVVPVFVWDPEAEGKWAPGTASRWWLHHSLCALGKRLHECGSRLIIARGDTLRELVNICSEVGAGTVYWNRRYEPSIAQRDMALERELGRQGVETRSFNGSLLIEPESLVKADGSPYQVFTPYWKQVQRRWRSPEFCAEPAELTGPGHWPARLALDDLGLVTDSVRINGFCRHWQPGELNAGRQLAHFAADTVGSYHRGRDHPARAGTSRLSPRLHFGELSPGQVLRALDPAGQLPSGPGRLAFVRELLWREFSYHLLWHFPDTPDEPLKAQFARFPWRQPEEYAGDLDAWRDGRTGIPLVDAGMRELRTTGWMHNRVRMVVASFLTKNLQIPWQEGARWFWETLVDADLANNTQGWQWTAGCGADASPYFRVFNPVLQGEKFDPQGDYVRHWCPELSGRPGKRVHHPLNDSEAQALEYPRARVDLPESRRRALNAWRTIRS